DHATPDKCVLVSSLVTDHLFDGRGGKGPVGVVVVVQGQANLLKIVAALHPPGGLAGLLHGGKEQGDQYADDGNHDKEFDESEAPTGSAKHGHEGYLLK